MRSTNVLHQLLRENSGVSGIFIALLAPILLGFVALGTEAGLWYTERRSLQTAADIAAVSAAYEVMAETGDEGDVAILEAERHGLSTSRGDTITVNYPPTSGPAAGDSDAVEVVLTTTQPPMFSALFLSDPIELTARAVTRYNATATACVLALDPVANRAINVAGTASLNMPNCVLATNSINHEAVSIRGSASIRALSLTVAGDYKIQGGGSLSSEIPPQTGSAQFPDPYADRTIPPKGPCNQNGYALNNSTPTTVSPGTYCNGMSFSSQSVANFTPGVYVVDGGSFTVNGGARVTCSGCTGTNGVTIILTGSGSNYATVRINGGANIELKAPTTGPYAGLVFFQDRNAPASASNVFNGGATMRFNGAMYFPKQAVDFSGNSTTGGNSCTQVVARTISFTGTTAFGNECDDSGTSQIISDGMVKLIE